MAMESNKGNVDINNDGILGFNLGAIRSKARRLGRRNSKGSPLGFLFAPTPRANTFDIERNAGGNANGTGGGSGLAPYATAPGRLSTAEEESQAAGRDVPLSAGQATQASTAANDDESKRSLTNDGMRNRRRMDGDEMNGGSSGEVKDDSHDSQDQPDPERRKRKQNTGLFRKAPGGPFTVKNQIQRTFLNSWINILLLAVPVGFAVNYAGLQGQIIFAVNFIAIIPLAAMLSFATEEIALRTGETLGGLINATFGNAVELIVAVMALVQGKVDIVQQSLVGSILSNLLLVMGFCFLLGGANRRVQYFNKTVSQTAASLLALAISAIIIPTIFDYLVKDNSHNAEMSHGVAVIVLAVYCSYLFFQLKTHSKVFSEESPKVEKESWRKSPDASGALAKAVGVMAQHGSGGKFRNEDGKEVFANMHKHDDEEDEVEEAQLSVPVALATLTISTIFVGFCAEFMVDGIEPVTKAGLSEEFVGLILLPIVGNAAEHVTAVTVAMKDKMDLAIGVAVGSSMQVSLFLIPLLVIIGWCMGNNDMTLAFDGFQVVILFVSVLLTNYLIADGESHWLEGMMLLCLYLIIAVCSYWYPPKQ